MKPFDTDHQPSYAVDNILAMLDAYMGSAAVGAAMELGLFWMIDKRICAGEEIAGTLELPLNRCLYWLQYLCGLGFLEQTPEGFSCSDDTRSAVLETYSQETWSLLAREAREQYPVFQHLAPRFRHQGSVWEAAGLDPPAYLERMNTDPARAREFTRMLFEIHQGIAKALAEVLDLSGVQRMMDLGGGSGVVSMALLRRYPDLQATVVDIPNVCSAGLELAQEHSLEGRLAFHPADFIQDDLPAGFDMIMECDVGVYSELLFKKLRKSLNAGGRYVIIDQFAPAERKAPPSRIAWALQGALRDPDFTYPTAQDVADMLENTGYHKVAIKSLPGLASEPFQFTGDMVLIGSRL